MDVLEKFRMDFSITQPIVKIYINKSIITYKKMIMPNELIN